eukprot:CAMPEP_0119389044 /NCGR_PEP_ID=MMETSP1334-20130426/107481_1 /TAXON_ID=127549 /ORGANISM="Calcidiscus leptoporus, Strain RCC1130" /LENGTH=111 /DNA_ID=CAMNT_0007411181 /DNA_START=266 /DNA_END=597 /DNA_ORIENTATION=-
MHVQLLEIVERDAMCRAALEAKLEANRVLRVPIIGIVLRGIAQVVRRPERVEALAAELVASVLRLDAVVEEAVRDPHVLSWVTKARLALWLVEGGSKGAQCWSIEDVARPA